MSQSATTESPFDAFVRQTTLLQQRCAAELNARQRSLQAKVRQLQVSLDAERTSRREMLLRKEAELASRDSQLQGLRRSEALLREERDALRSTNTALEHEIAVLQRLKATEQRLRTERDTVRVDFSKLQKEVAALRVKNAEQVDVEKQLRNDLAVSRGANFALRGQVVSLRRQQLTSEAAADQMRRERAVLEEQVANLRRRTEEDAATTARLRRENTALETDLATLRRQKQDDTATIARLRRDSERLAEFVESERLWRRARSDLEQLHREWQERIRAEEDAARKREEQRRRETAAFNRLSGQWDALRQSSTQIPGATRTPREQYETVWSQRLCPSSKLTFDTFPWPVAPGAHIINPAAVETFLLDGVDASRRKQAIRSQLLRWHPDKFTARGVLDHVTSSDWERVLQRQKEVVLCLTTLLARV